MDSISIYSAKNAFAYKLNLFEDGATEPPQQHRKEIQSHL